MEVLSEKIKRLRAAKKLTQEELGKAVGVSRVAVTKWENGDTENLKLANLKRLCSVFGISVAELIDVKADYILANDDGNTLLVAEVKQDVGTREERFAMYAALSESALLERQRNGIAEEATPTAPIYSLKPPPASDPDIDAVVDLMKNTDKTGRAIVLVQVKLALAAYKPAEVNHAS